MNSAGLISALLVIASASMVRLVAPVRGRVAAALRLPASSPSTISTQERCFGGAPRRFAAALSDAGFEADPARAWTTWIIGFALAVAAGLIAGGAGAALVAAGAATAGPVVALRLLGQRSRDRFDAALPGAVEAVARSLRSGASLHQAVAEAATATPGKLGAELGEVVEAAGRGATMTLALERWADRRPHAGVRLVVSALCLGAETGGALARAVDGVAATLRQRLAARAEARALATQARASAVVLAAAPPGFAVLAILGDPRTSAFLFRTPTGLVCLAAGLTLDGVGALWMARLTRIEVGP